MIGLKQLYLKISFYNQSDLIKIRKEILSAVRKNKEKLKMNTYYTEMLTNDLMNKTSVTNTKVQTDHVENILDIR